MTSNTETTDRFLRLKEVETIIGLKRSWIYDAMDRGDFPRQVKIGRRAVGWRQTDVDAWLHERVVESDLPSRSDALSLWRINGCW